MSKLLEVLDKLGIFKFITKAWKRHKKRIKATNELLVEFPRIRSSIDQLTRSVDQLTRGSIEELHSTLDELCYMIITKGYSTEAEFNRLQQVYSTYHNLGGNGSGTKLYDQAASLPIKEEK